MGQDLAVEVKASWAASDLVEAWAHSSLASFEVLHHSFANNWAQVQVDFFVEVIVFFHFDTCHLGSHPHHSMVRYSLDNIDRRRRLVAHP